jgi:Ca-activated chloride channel family protein
MGCLIFSLLLGELLFYLFPPNIPQSSPQALVILIDTSGSMDGGKLAEVKVAAKNFVDRQNLVENEIAVLGFGSDVQIGTSLTKNFNAIEEAIANLNDGGGTMMDLAIVAATEQLQSTDLNKNILLFTDGEPGYSGANLDEEIDKTLMAGEEARKQQINLVAVATGDADTYFLEQLTQDPNLVFYAESGQFDQAFQSAEKALNSVVGQDAAVGYSAPWQSIVITGLWGGFLTVGASLGLIIGQNYFLRRRLLSQRELIFSIAGGLAAGMIAGAVAQVLYVMLSQFSNVAIAARIIGWGILGGIVGSGMSLFVPNLSWKKGLTGGLLGGVLGSLGFLGAAYLLGDVAGRSLGAISIGFFLGLMIALIEQVSRQAWLVVHWGEKETTTISLGQQPIILGSSPDAHIYLRKDHGYPPVTGKIYQQHDQIYLEFDPAYASQKSMKKSKQELKDGDSRKFDQLSFEIHLTTPNIQKVK